MCSRRSRPHKTFRAGHGVPDALDAFSGWTDSGRTGGAALRRIALSRARWRGGEWDEDLCGAGRPPRQLRKKG